MDNLEKKGNIKTDSSPVMCTVTEDNGFIMDINVTCEMEYEFTICDQNLYDDKFVEDSSHFEETIDKKIKRESYSALQIVFAQITGEDISYNKLKQSEELIADKLKLQMCDRWRDIYGVNIGSIVVSNVKATASDEMLLESFARSATLTNAKKISSEIKPWTCQCGNVSNAKFCTECGSKRPPQPEDGWKCRNCNTFNHGKFCTECGCAFE